MKNKTKLELETKKTVLEKKLFFFKKNVFEKNFEKKIVEKNFFSPLALSKTSQHIKVPAHNRRRLNVPRLKVVDRLIVLSFKAKW